MIRRTRVLLLAAVLGWLGAAQAQAPEKAGTTDNNLPYFELQRDDRPITVQQTASDAQGGIAVTRGGSTCRKNENISFFYAPKPREVETKVNNTVIRSNAVLRSQPKDGGAEAQDEAVLDFFPGSLGYDAEAGCPRNVKRDKTGRVTVTEGRTTVNGSGLLYTNADGEGKMTGPIKLERRKEGDSPALTASSKAMDFNIDDDITTLRGDVRVESDGRTSRAEVLELDEEAGFAILRGNPATSEDEDGKVRGRVIEYDLDSNDVIVTGGVQGSFDIDMGEGESLPEVDTSFGLGDDANVDTGEESTGEEDITDPVDPTDAEDPTDTGDF